MNRGTRRTEFHLSVTHAVIMVGLTLGCLFAAFLIGYRSGRGAGYQDASLHTVGNAPRFGIPKNELPQKVPDELVSKVYAKLQENIGPKDKSAESPKLEKIPEVNTKPKRKGAKKNNQKTLDDLQPKKTDPKKKEVVKEKPEEKKIVEKKPVEEKPIQVAKKAPEPKETIPSKKSQPNTLGGLFELGNTPKKTAPALVPPKVAEKPVQVAPVKVAKPKEEIPAPAKETQVVKNVPEPKIEKPPVAKTIPPVKLRAGWYVQVAAPNLPSEAQALVGQLKGNGFLDSNIQAATVKGKQYYRVLVGPEDTAVLAQRLLSQVSREPYVNTKPYLKRIGN